MKFGNNLSSNQIPHWSEHYIDYDSLKAMLKQAVIVPSAGSDIERGNVACSLTLKNQCEHFLSKVRDEIAKTSGFYTKTKRKLSLEYSNLMNAFDNTGIHVRKNSWPHSVTTLSSSVTVTNHPSPDPSSGVSTMSDLKERVKNLYLLAIDLEEFFSINQMGFSKILKKADKIFNQNNKKILMRNVELNFSPHELQDLEKIIKDLEALYKRYFGEDQLNPLRQVHREKLFIERNSIMKGIEEEEQEEEQEQEQGQKVQGHGQAQVINKNEKINSNLKPVSATAISVKEGHHSHSHASKGYNIIKMIVGLLIAVSLVLLIIWMNPMKNASQNNCLAILVFASVLWSAEVVPLYVTSMFIPLLVILLGVMIDPATGLRLPASKSAIIVFRSMFSQVIMLMLGGFSIATALRKYGISKAIAERIIFKSQKNSHTLLLSVLCLAAFSSMWISNVAAPALCFSLLQPLLKFIPATSPMAKRLILAVAFGSNIGGMLSPISSPQNIIAIERISSSRFQPSWFQWLAISLPVGIISIILCWLVLSMVITGAYRLSQDFVKPETNPDFKLLDKKRIFVILVALVTVGLWCEGNKVKEILGPMGTVALIPLIAYFGTGILDKEDFNGFFWNIVMLAMGGLALGEAIYNSGLLMTIGKIVEKTFENYGLYTQLLVSTSIVFVFSTFISHTVSALIFLPLMQTIGESMKHTRLFIMCGAFACSIGMALPISGFPNITAIAQEDASGRPFLTSWDFIKSGLIISVIILALVMSLGFGIMYMLEY